MIEVSELYDLLEKKNVTFYTGVPDSQLRQFCDYVTARLGVNGKKHMIAANEGNAVALAAGYHLATGKIGLVYMQNSGLGNAVNPITSLTTQEVYGIPVIYMIGWRGQPGVKDEPQHVKQGKITQELLGLLGIETYVISERTTITDLKEIYEDKFVGLLAEGKSVAFLVEKNSLINQNPFQYVNDNHLLRERAIEIILEKQPFNTVNVATTGKISREVFEYREKKGETHARDFLTVGSMGHASMIALAIAEHTQNSVWCFDGDGAMLMHLGASALIANRNPKKYVHILFNNGAHETVGGMPTIAGKMDWQALTKTLGYTACYQVRNEEALVEVLDEVSKREGLFFVEVLVSIESRKDLMRPNITPIENKRNFMEHISSEANCR